MGTPDSLEPMNVKTRGIVYPELLGPRHHCPPGPMSVWSGLTPSLSLLMLSFRRHLHISLAQKEKVLWGRISGKSVSCFHFPSNPGATDNPGPSATSCSLATRSRGGLIGAAVAVPFHFLPSEGARGVGARWGKEVLGCEEKGGAAPKLRSTGGFRQNLGEPQPRPFSTMILGKCVVGI